MVSTIHYLLKTASLKTALALNSGWNVYAKDGGGDEQPLIARVQLSGQLAVTSVDDVL